ncbi:hypothetical protein BLNAU_3444 [Blattamonas nauphoetae]|uniref:Uncharacterized protein n=1 Tax=Blattamonas nauphoetae TaxID=2049346 RepID=A0ABQ9YD12_9EUKA|nr:hypothetical protein BLNAU_3444 [Blattamonas nauphoetae]
MDELHEPFLNFDENSKLLFTNKSSIYNSLVALVKAEYPFNDALLDRAVRFLKNLGPKGDQKLAHKLITDLVPSSAGSPSGFIDSILTLVSSPHSTVAASALSFLQKTTFASSKEIRSRLVKSDLVSKVLATIQPHTLPVVGNEEIFVTLIHLFEHFVSLASPTSLIDIDTTVADAFNHREMIFEKVVLPSSQLMAFLISNRNMLKGDLFKSFISLMANLLDISPFHRPISEFILASPIVRTFSRCLSFVEDDFCLFDATKTFSQSLEEWRNHGPEVVQSGKRMMQALISDGFEDTLEQMLKHRHSIFGRYIVVKCSFFSQFLGSNVDDAEE